MNPSKSSKSNQNSIKIYRSINPSITGSDIAMYEACAKDSRKINLLLSRAESGDDAAEESLWNIVLYGMARNLYLQIWDTESLPHQVQKARDEAMKDLIRAAEYDRLSRIKTDCVVLYVFHIYASNVSRRLSICAHDKPTNADIANEMYVTYLSHWSRIVVVEMPKQYILRIAENTQSKILRSERTILSVQNKITSSDRKLAEKLLEISGIPDVSEQIFALNHLLQEDPRYNYKVEQLFFQFANKVCSIYSSYEDTPYSIAEFIPAPDGEKGYREAEEENMHRYFLRLLSDPLMRIIIEETYLSPDSRDDPLVKKRECRRAQAVLEKRYGIDEDLYNKELRLAERILAYEIKRAG